MGLADLDPVIVGVLEIGLAHAVAAIVERHGFTPEVAVADAALREIGERGFEMRRGQAEMRGDWAFRRRAVGAGDEMDRAAAVEGEPADRRPSSLVLDLLEPERFSVKRGAGREIADFERNVVDAKLRLHAARLPFLAF